LSCSASGVSNEMPDILRDVERTSESWVAATDYGTDECRRRVRCDSSVTVREPGKNLGIVVVVERRL
jgi:hypothetical protein